MVEGPGSCLSVGQVEWHVRVLSVIVNTSSLGYPRSCTAAAIRGTIGSMSPDPMESIGVSVNPRLRFPEIHFLPKLNW